MTRTLPFRTFRGLQSERILGIAAAMLAHAALLMLLFRPPEYRSPLPIQTPTIPIDWIVPQPRPVAVKPAPDKSHAQQQTHARIQARPAPPQDVIARPTPVSISLQPAQPDSPIVVPPVVNPQPVESSLEPLLAPAPAYPREALRDGITGQVVLELLVGIDGRVLAARVVGSSGNRQLDAAARETVLRQWRFQPATRDGQPVQALGRLPIVFSLDGR